jgi:leucyl aminopeptidase
VSIIVSTARTIPRDSEAVGLPVASAGPVPRALGASRAELARLGFEGSVGQALALPARDGRSMVAVGVGEPGTATAAGLRTAAAALARAADRFSSVATTLAGVGPVPAAEAAQAVVEGALLASYRFVTHKADKGRAGLQSLVLAGSDPAALEAGARRGASVGEAVRLARDLANTPPSHLTARRFAAIAQETAERVGLASEVLDEDAIAENGLGGLLGVNQGSAEPPRVVKLTYAPKGARATVGLVGKGVMYDSGGISLKPSDGMHVLMKMDMSGAAAVLGAMSALPALAPRVRVVGWMLCTDNMPSGSAMKLGDVLTIRNGATVEIHNTDAEGRLLLADGLCLAVEEGCDAVVDIATLTGACVTALGQKIAGLMGNHDVWVEQVAAASQRADEPTWRLPLPREYRKLLDSNVADLRNVGGPYGGALTAGLFLERFVGDTPWAHLDIAGPMNVDADEGWLTKGATAFGVRTLVELVEGFRPLS